MSRLCVDKERVQSTEFRVQRFSREYKSETTKKKQTYYIVLQ